MPEPPNPYQAPRAALGPEQVPPSRRTGWKVYAYAVVALQLFGLYYGLAEIDAIRALDYSVTVVGVVGLFGFAYRRPILERWFWRPWSLLNPAWDFAMGAWVYPRENPQFARETAMVYFVLMLLFVPEYVALIRYGYFSPELWSKAAEKDTGSSPS
jgi:hypothetical protein